MKKRKLQFEAEEIGKTLEKTKKKLEKETDMRFRKPRRRKV